MVFAKTHSLQPGVTIGALDALALAESPEFMQENLVVTTPNASWVPEFPKVLDGICLHDDGNWGGHEYSRLPQVHTNNNIHMACIPRRSPNDISASERERLFWYDVMEDSDFIITGKSTFDVQIGSFRIALRSDLARVFEVVAILAKGAYSKLNLSPDTSKLGLIGNIIERGRNAIDRMRDSPDTFKTSLMAFREVQRMGLELWGFEVYATEVHHRIVSGPGLASAHPTLKVRGAFTFTAAVTQQLFAIGIPVWYIRPRSSITHNTKIFNIVPVSPWSTVVSNSCMYLKDDKYHYLRIKAGKDLRSFEGHIYSDDGMTELMHCMRGRVTTSLQNNVEKVTAKHSAYVVDRNTFRRGPEPFTGPIAATAASPSVSGSSRIAGKKRRHDDSTNPPFESPSVSFRVPNGFDGTPDQPAFHPVISDILRRLSPVPKPSEKQAVYLLPPPWLLCQSKASTAEQYYHNWIRIRSACLRLALEGDFLKSGLAFRSINDWRTILFGVYEQDTELPLASDSTPKTIGRIYDTLPEKIASSSRTPDRREEAVVQPGKKKIRVKKAAMKCTFGALLGLPSYSTEMVPLWRGSPVSRSRVASDKVLRQEVQWDLTECLWHCDLHLLDTRMAPREGLTSDEKESRIKDVAEIFHGVDVKGKVNFFLPENSQPVDLWCTALSRSSLKAMIKVFSRWPKFPASLLTVDIYAVNDNDRVHTFRSLLDFFAITFSREFERLPFLPCSVPKSLLKPVV